MERNPRRPSNREHARRRTAERHAAELNSMLRATAAGTAEHSHAVERLALRIADHLGLDGELRRTVGLAARLHDIGKSAIPSSVLEKDAPLSAYEWEMMRDHTVFGEEILRGGSDMDAVARYVRHAHEHWDGKGYPDGLAGEQIPLVSRIIFCADAYDAICADRPYRRGASPAGGSPRSGAAREPSSIRESSTLWRGRCGPSSTAGPAGSAIAGRPPAVGHGGLLNRCDRDCRSRRDQRKRAEPCGPEPGSLSSGECAEQRAARSAHAPNPLESWPGNRRGPRPEGLPGAVAGVTEPTRRPAARVAEPTCDRELEGGSRAVPPWPRPPLEPPAIPPSWTAAVQRPRRRPPCRTRFRFLPCPTRPRSWTTYRASRANPAGADSAQRTPAVS